MIWGRINRIIFEKWQKDQIFQDRQLGRQK